MANPIQKNCVHCNDFITEYFYHYLYHNSPCCSRRCTIDWFIYNDESMNDIYD